MLVLALDACLAACQGVLIDGPRVLARASEPMTRGHQERIAPMTRDLMAEAGAPFARLDRIAVTVGPGSFTGLRVGLAFAKGLGLALAKPCVGIGTLPALAFGETGPCAAVIDAGRGRVYLQAFAGDQPLTGPLILEIAAAVARLVETFPSGRLRLVGPGAGLLAGVSPAVTLVERPVADPVAVARMAAAAPLLPAEPLYLRPADAIPKSARLA